MAEARGKGLLNPESRYVAMVVKDGKVRERVLRTGVADSTYYELKDGLAEGEKVLTGPLRKLKELKDRATVKLRPKSDSQVEEDARKRQGSGS